MQADSDNPAARSAPSNAGLIRLDLHCHSEASADCITPLTAFPERCRTRGIHVQAITDHNEIWGAQELQKRVETSEASEYLSIIVGEEVSTNEGEIIGLFLEEKIPAGLSPEETVAQIKAQGGLVLLPHGFDPLKRHALREEARERLAESFDIIEVFNARISNLKWNAAASVWAAKHALPVSAGSDAHTLKDIGSACIEAPSGRADTPEHLLKLLKDSESHIDGEWTHPAVALAYKAWDYLKSRYQNLTSR